MVKVSSAMLPLGTSAPQFSLPDVCTGKTIALHNPGSAIATVIMFICNHCPYVKHVNPELTRLAHEYLTQGVQFIAINANDVGSYPDDSPENMKRVAEEQHYPFPYLYDETQEVAKAYQATCTPDFFVFDKQMLLVYRGQLDDSRPGNHLPLNGSSIRSALNSMLHGQPITDMQKPSIGCNIKWKA